MDLKKWRWTPVKFGCCVSLWEEEILQLSGAGADYAETGFSSLWEKSLEEVKARAAQVRDAGVSVEAMNLLFPGTLRLTGPEADVSLVDRYLEDTLPKAAVLGPKVVVFGSGGSRRVPEDFPKEEAFSQLVSLCRDHIAPAMAAYGITCCVEPLHQGECNILNTSGECFRLVEEVDRPSFRLLVDLYHFQLEGEELSSLSRYGNKLCHTHIASARNHRLIPLPGDGEPYPAFFQALRAMGYQGRMSLEGSAPQGMAQIAASLAYLRKLAEEAGL